MIHIILGNMFNLDKINSKQNPVWWDVHKRALSTWCSICSPCLRLLHKSSRGTFWFCTKVKPDQFSHHYQKCATFWIKVPHVKVRFSTLGASFTRTQYTHIRHTGWDSNASYSPLPRYSQETGLLRSAGDSVHYSVQGHSEGKAGRGCALPTDSPRFRMKTNQTGNERQAAASFLVGFLQ